MIYPSVKKVEALQNYIVKLIFDNNEIRFFDLKKYFHIGKFNELSNPNLFKQVKISFDSIEWPNGIDIDPEVLYLKGTKNI